MPGKLPSPLALREQKQHLLPGLLFSSAIAFIARRRRSLNRSGVVGAITSGTLIFGLGGWSWGLALLYFLSPQACYRIFASKRRPAPRQINSVKARSGILPRSPPMVGLLRCWLSPMG